MSYVTLEDIEAEIASEHYFTAADGVRCAGATMLDVATEEPPLPQPLHLLTFCVLVLRNGFTVSADNACARAEAFDSEAGRRAARRRALDKLTAYVIYGQKSSAANYAS
jgi:hypothetical protein